MEKLASAVTIMRKVAKNPGLLGRSEDSETGFLTWTSWMGFRGCVNMQRLWESFCVYTYVCICICVHVCVWVYICRWVYMDAYVG